MTAIEVELAEKDPRRLERICRGWTRARHVERVYYLAGAHSILAAPGGNLCKQTLTMPTTIVGQDGAQITQSTPIETSTRA